VSKQGSEKKEFVRGMSNYPPSHPRSSPSGFSGASVLFHHPDSGTEERQVCGEKGVGGGHPPKRKQISSEENSAASEIINKELETPVFQNRAGALWTWEP